MVKRIEGTTAWADKRTGIGKKTSIEDNHDTVFRASMHGTLSS
jgi:hypothetical protein